MIITSIASILALTFIASIIRRYFFIKICPICSGVALTWMWMLCAYFLSYKVDTGIILMLMGGSVVGASYLLEKITVRTTTSLLWRTIFILSGFLAAYYLINSSWILFFGSSISAILSACVYCLPQKQTDKISRTAELESKLKNCC